MGPHPDDIAEMQGTPLGDFYENLHADINARYWMLMLECEQAKWYNKGIFRWLFG